MGEIKQMRTNRVGARRMVGAMALAGVVLLAGCDLGGMDDPEDGSKAPATTPAGSTGAEPGGSQGAEAGAPEAPVEQGTDLSPPGKDGMVPAAEHDEHWEAEPPVDEHDEHWEDEEPTDEHDEHWEDEEPTDEHDEHWDEDEHDEHWPGEGHGGGHGSNGLEPGDPCSLEEGSVDCIDPDGDGEGVYLIDGAACLAMHADAALCADTDGDGRAGEGDTYYPPAGVGQACSKEEGDPDCVDPDGDGEGTILIAGEECLAMYADDALCEDTDGDLVAGETGSDGSLPFPYEG